MSIDNLMNRIARIEGRIEQLKQRINSLSGGPSFDEQLKKAAGKIEDTKSAVKKLKNAAQMNSLADVNIKMPKITFDNPIGKKAPAAVVANPAKLAMPELRGEIGSIILEKSVKHEIDPLLISAIMAVESDFNPRAVSDKGAIGLMQLMPGTASELGVNPHNMNQNIDGGTRYIKQMLEKFSGDLKLALAAYNAGPNAVIKHGGIPPNEETQNYVVRVLENYERLLDENKSKTEGKTVKNPEQAVIESAAAMSEAVLGGHKTADKETIDIASEEEIE